MQTNNLMHHLYPHLADMILNPRPKHTSHFIANIIYCILGSASAPAVASTLNCKDIERILVTIKPSFTTILLSLKYVERFAAATSVAKRNSCDLFRIWLAALMMSDSFHSDAPYSTRSWSSVSSFSKADIVTMRRQFVNALSFNLECREEEFGRWLALLNNHLDALYRDKGAVKNPVASPIQVELVY